MVLNTMVEWEEWEWEEEMQAMLVSEELFIQACKLTCIPPGLAFHARSMKKLTIGSVKGLQSLENFASIVELQLQDIPYLTRISNFPKLQKLEINLCPKLESLQEMNALRKFMLTVFYNEDQLPMFLQSLKPRHLLLDCSFLVLALMDLGKSGPEWEKFSHIQRVEAYSDDKGIEKRWHLFYTREPYSMETNYSYQELCRFDSSFKASDEDVDSIQDTKENERTGHDQQDEPDSEDVLSALAGLFGPGEEDEEDVDNNQDVQE